MTELTPTVTIQNLTGEIHLYKPIDIVDEAGVILSAGVERVIELKPEGLSILNNSIDSTRLSGIAFSGDGFAYDNLVDVKAVTWENITTKIEAIAAVSQASNSSTLNINNTLSVQYGETIDPPTKDFIISTDSIGSRIGINGNYGAVGDVLISGGGAGALTWGVPTETVPTLEDVLTSAVGANDAGNNSITGLSDIQISDNLGSGSFVQLGCLGSSLYLSTSSVVGTKLFSGTYLPVYVDGEARYIQLFQDPP